MRLYNPIFMENTEIISHAELLLRIKYLKSEKLRQEDEIKDKVKSLAFNVGLFSFFKGTSNAGNGKKNIFLNLINIGVGNLAGYAIDKILGKKPNFRNIMRSTLLEAFSILLINLNVSSMISRLTEFIHSSTVKQ